MTRARSLFLPFFCIAFLAVHWLNQAVETYGPMFDEAQYWFWAKHPAWGYFSKPPMIGWLIAASTSLFGDNNFGIKMLSPLLLLATGGMLYVTALRLDYGDRIARWVLLSYLTLPLVTGNAMFITTDVPLQLCWAIGLYAAVMAMRVGDARYWLLVGIAAGVGMLSKYTMVAFGASVLLAILLIPANRRHLRSPYLWLGGALAIMLFAPNLLWNAHHQFVTLHHTDQNVISKEVELYPADMVAFIGAQFGVFGPILLTTLLLSLRRCKWDADKKLLHCFIWPLAIAGVVVSLLAGAQAHWIAPVYLAGLLIVVPYLAERAPRLLKSSLGLHLAFLVLFYAAPYVIAHLHLKHDPLARLFVWDTLAEQLRPVIAAHPDSVLMTNERKIAAVATYRWRDLRGVEEPVYKWNPKHLVWDHYGMLTEDADLSGRPFLLIMRLPIHPDFRIPASAKPLGEYELEHFRFGVYRLAPVKTRLPF